MSRITRFAKDVVNGWLAADAFSLAATLAYYAIFSIAPLLLLSIHLASLFLDRSVAVERLTNELIGVIGPTGSDAIRQMLEAAGTAQTESWSGLIGLGVLLFAATGFVGSLQDALDRIWEAPPRPGGFGAFIKGKIFTFTLILAAAFLLLISLVLSTVMTAVAGAITDAFGLPDGVVAAVIATANFLLATLIFAAIFKYVPSVFVTWRAAVVAGLITAALFALGRLALAWYLGREAEASAYGAATSLVLLLIWVYYSAQILFFGAQFSQSLQTAWLGRRPVAGPAPHRPPSQLSPDTDLANVAGALVLGFVLGALVTQRPRPRSTFARPRRAPDWLAFVRSWLG
jgi:membrane protein